jgi:DNA-binding NtrC family response regulator
MKKCSRGAAPIPLGSANPAQPAILMVEDDWSIRRFIGTVLRQSTRALVIDAADPDSALCKAAEFGHPIDVLISDINLSSTRTGVDLAHQMVALYPSVHVLLMSATDFPRYDIPPAWRFLPKPFPMPVFLDCVNDLCGFRSPAYQDSVSSRT